VENTFVEPINGLVQKADSMDQDAFHDIQLLIVKVMIGFSRDSILPLPYFPSDWLNSLKFSNVIPCALVTDKNVFINTEQTSRWFLQKMCCLCYLGACQKYIIFSF